MCWDLTAWSMTRRSCAADLRGCKCARLCTTFPLAIRAWLLSVALYFPFLAEITCSYNPVHSTAFFRRLSRLRG